MRVRGLLIAGVLLAGMIPAAAGAGDDAPRTGVQLSSERGSPPAAAPFDGDAARTARVDADTPVTVGVAVSRSRFGDHTAPYALLSRDDRFPDSLAAAPLTAGGPLLFTQTAALPAATEAELSRVVTSDGVVYLLGGAGAISTEVETAVQALGLSTRRLAGPSRVETAIAVADELRRVVGPGTQVTLARADGPATNPTAAWADSVTGGAWAASAKVPLLITATEGVHPAVAEALQRYAPTQTILLGGTAALSEAVAAGVPGPRRVAGSDRAATAVRIATDLWAASDRYLVANGFHADGWAFGLAAAGLSADHTAPLLVVQSDQVPSATRDHIAARGGSGAVEFAVMGAASQIQQSVVAALDSVSSGQPPPADDPGGCVNINTASFEDLQRIVHIGPDRAQEIINLRPFSSVDDLQRVDGIGPGRLQDIKDEGLACV